MCVQISYSNGRNPIETVGGPNGAFLGGDGGQWRLPVAQVNELIASGRWYFFVDVPTGTERRRVAVIRDGPAFIKTESDGQYPNNLYALPEQADDVPESPPAFPANLPPAATPALSGILTDGRRDFDASPSGDGWFWGHMPTRYVIIRLEAPFFSRLQLRVNGAVPLYEAPSGTTRLPDPEEAAGWWAFDSVGYWGRAPSSVSDMVLERDRTRFQIRLRLPDAVRTGRAVSIRIACRSINPQCPQATMLSPPVAVDIRDRGTQIVTVSGGGGAGGASPSGSGTLHLGRWTPSQADQFTMTTSVIDPGLAGAVITTVENASTDVNMRGVRLVNLRHQEPEPGGSVRTAPSLGAGEATAAFAPLPVLGTWSVRVADISATLVDPRLIRLNVSWSRM